MRIYHNIVYEIKSKPVNHRMIIKDIKKTTKLDDKEFEKAKAYSLILETAFVDKNNKDHMAIRVRTYNHLKNEEPASDEEIITMFLSLCVILLADRAYSNFPEAIKEVLLAPLEKYEEIVKETGSPESITKH